MTMSGESVQSDSTDEESDRSDAIEEAETDDGYEQEVTPQSAALRRQQYAVGVGAAILSGFAVAIGSIQQYPSLPDFVPLVAGFLGAGLVYWIVKRSLYPTEAELAAGD